MKKKLTLTIEESVKKRAKRYAKANNISISKAVEQFLDTMSASDSEFTPAPGSAVEELAGSLPLASKQSYKDILTENLKKDYLSKDRSD